MPTDDTQRNHHHHEACCSLPGHLLVHALQMLITSNLLLGERIEAMDDTLKQVTDKLTLLHTKIDDMAAAWKADLAGLKPVVAQQELDPEAQRTINAAIDSLLRQVDDRTAEAKAAIPTGTNPPAETLTGFQITPQQGIDFTPNSGILIEITAKSSSGQTLALYRGPITISTDEPSTHPQYAFTPEEAGVHVDTVSFSTPGVHVITVTDVAKGVSSLITVNVVSSVGVPLPPSSLALEVTGSVVAGQPVEFVVHASSPNYIGTIGFTSNNAQTGLPSQYTFTAADQGVHAFSIFHPPAGSTIVVTATDTVNPSITGSMTVVVG